MKITIKEYKARRIVNKHKYLDSWFWTRYSAHPYIGCVHGCEYCYTREEKYAPYDDPADFVRTIKVKTNAPTLLQKELPRFPRDLISIGDWQPIEKRYRLSRRMLQVCHDLKFPVFILEKSDLVVQDLNLLRQMASKDITVLTGFSIITTKDDKTRRLFEPGAPSVKNRFNAMRKFARAGLYTGTALIPVLPYIYDDDENLEEVIERTKRSGGQYVLVGSLTLGRRQREWFYDALRRYDPSLLQHYEQLYDHNTAYAPHPNYVADLGRRVEKLCAKYGLRDRIPRPIPSNHLLAFNMRVAEILYDRAYRLTLKGVTGFREFALRKAGRIVDSQSQDLSDVLEKEGRAGLRAIHGIGPKLSAEIESAILEAKAEVHDRSDRAKVFSYSALLSF
ncbi:MAG: hypothetical protein ACFFCO_04135 [Promethearchaeota archaeon]